VTGRSRLCRCCEGPSTGPYCQPCHDHAVRHASLVAAVIRELWGDAGLTSYEVTLRARRLAAKRTTTRRTA
jgi:hypothetical protein